MDRALATATIITLFVILLLVLILLFEFPWSHLFTLPPLFWDLRHSMSPSRCSFDRVLNLSYLQQSNSTPVEPLPCFALFAETCSPSSDVLDISATSHFLFVLQLLATGSHGVNYSATYSKLFIFLVGSLLPFTIEIAAFSIGSLHSITLSMKFTRVNPLGS